MPPAAEASSAPRPGFNALATAETDGYTLGQLTTPGFVTLDFTTPMPFTLESFEIVGNMVGVSSVIAVQKNGRFDTLQAFLDAAKESTQPINVGVGSIGNDDHLAGLQFMALSGLKFNLIPFGDNSQTRNALLGGHVDVAMMSNAEIGRFVEDLKPLAIAANERDEKLPEVPTFKELGFNLIAGTTHIVGIPKGAPQEIIAKWQECFAKVSTDPGFLAEAENRSVSVMYMDAAQASRHVASQEQEYRALFEKHPW